MTNYSAPNNKSSFTREDLNLTLIKRESNILPTLLWDLLHHGHHHPHEGEVRDIITKYLKETCEVAETNISVDKMGNLICDLRTDISTQRTMFSCHMDTVHTGMVKVWPHISKNTGSIFKDGLVYGKVKQVETGYKVEGDDKVYSLGMLTKYFEMPEDYGFVWEGKRSQDEKGRWVCEIEITKTRSRWPEKDVLLIENFKPFIVAGKTVFKDSILGADDKIGCYILCKLIEAKKPGLYVFHVGEECGAHGSRYIATHSVPLIENIQRCVAFDRKGYGDVIRTQGAETASKAFTEALAEALNKGLPTKHNKFVGNIDGLFTDSAVYRDIIPECTNLSVGYFNMHGENEHFDYIWLEQCLLPAIMQVDWEALATTRDPKAVVVMPQQTKWWGRRSNNYEVNNNQTKSGANVTILTPRKHLEEGPNKKLIDWGDRSRVFPPNAEPILAKDTTIKTPMAIVPFWTPEMGCYSSASEEAMLRIVHGYIHHHRLNIRDTASLIVYQAQMIDKLRAEYRELDRFVSGA